MRWSRVRELSGCDMSLLERGKCASTDHATSQILFHSEQASLCEWKSVRRVRHAEAVWMEHGCM